jgi:hypothetical protein
MKAFTIVKPIYYLTLKLKYVNLYYTNLMRY